MASWPVADKRLTINEKNICLVQKSRPDICSFTSLSIGYLPRLTGSAGSRLTDLQAETTGTTSREILFPEELRKFNFAALGHFYISRNEVSLPIPLEFCRRNKKNRE
jgi:hypothetical protein